MQPADVLGWFRNAGIIGVVVALCGCARLPPAGVAQPPPIPTGMARVWFYREDMPNETQERPYVRMNGAVIAISEDGGAFYRDVPPGQYYVTVDSYGEDINQFPHIAVVAGQTVYLQIIGSKWWASGGGASQNWARPTFYVWVMPPQIAGPAIDHSQFYPNAS
jgi:hypothetical protein